MADLEIKGMTETSFLDWDGKIVTTLYLPLCNFRCPFCHNSGLVVNPHEFETIPLDKIEKYLLEHQDFLDGICLTGGEPLLHKGRGLRHFMRRIKNHGFLIKLDTNGADPDGLQELIDAKLVDYIAMDLKAPLDQRYDRLTGTKTELEQVKRSVQLIMGSGLHYEFRTTVVPGLLDLDDIKHMAEGIAGAKRFVLQQFAPSNCYDEALRKAQPYPKEKLVEMVEAARHFVPNTSLRGA